MNRTGTGVRVLGTLRTAEGTGAVRVEDWFATDVRDLWSALTEPERLARWLGEVEGDLRLGGTFRARFTASEWEGTCRVEACEPPRRLRLLTTGDGETDEHALEATLTPEGHGTVLVVEERGIPEGQLPAYGAGLQVHVEDLAAHLDGRESCDARARWTELMPAYRELPLGGTDAAALIGDRR